MKCLKKYSWVKVPRGEIPFHGKGVFFDDDDFEHMSCSIDASWGKMGMTEIRICDYRELRKSDVFR